MFTAEKTQIRDDTFFAAKPGERRQGMQCVRVESAGFFSLTEGSAAPSKFHHRSFIRGSQDFFEEKSGTTRVPAAIVHSPDRNIGGWPIVVFLREAHKDRRRAGALIALGCARPAIFEIQIIARMCNEAKSIPAVGERGVLRRISHFQHGRIEEVLHVAPVDLVHRYSPYLVVSTATIAWVEDTVKRGTIYR